VSSVLGQEKLNQKWNAWSF